MYYYLLLSALHDPTNKYLALYFTIVMACNNDNNAEIIQALLHF